jgi:hypothetical protein
VKVWNSDWAVRTNVMASPTLNVMSVGEKAYVPPRSSRVTRNSLPSSVDLFDVWLEDVLDSAVGAGGGGGGELGWAVGCCVVFVLLHANIAKSDKDTKHNVIPNLTTIYPFSFI